MKKRRITSAILAGLMVLASFGFTFAANAADEGAGKTLTIDFADYQDGIVNGADSATLETVEKDGKKAVKITPNPKTTSTSINIDGYNYRSAGIDLEYYRYAAIEYYYESENPVRDTLAMTMYKSGDIFTKDSVAGTTRDNIAAGSWNVAVFDFRAIEPVLNRANSSLLLNQIHIRPFAKTKPQQLSENDVMYISRIMFFENKPEFIEHSSYMNGYTDGTFLPGGTMTRAEACTVIARLLEKEENIAGYSAFMDVPADQWFAKYVAFCEAKGLLGAYSGYFLPNQPITRAEFSELVYLTKLAQDKGIAASFADVAATHPRYASIMSAASAGLINGYAEADGTFTFRPDNTITRAEVVTIINRARGTSKKPAGLTEETVLLFTDVDKTHWAFADIAEATVAHVESNGAWAYTTEDPAQKLAEKIGGDAVYGFAAGNAKVAELDALEAKRIEEIRNTPNIQFSGNKIYVSSSTGDDKNSGTSPDAPVKTTAQANKLVSSGGAVLFKRGDLWRAERFTAKNGVTYSAYGEGAKPVFYGSPENGAVAENWSLVHEDASTGALIWMYKNQGMKDVGTLVFNDGEGFAMKEIPSLINENYVVRGTKDTPFDYKKELDRNLEFFHQLSNPTDAKNSTGAIYLRCDNGNPGKVFDSIEFIPLGNIISVGSTSDVTISNLCLKYASFGISGGNHTNLNISDMEIGWIGGNNSGYRADTGVAVRYGNGIECYGSCNGFYVDNCYIYQCYDAGVTHQATGDGNNNILMDYVSYTNNVLTDNVYNIEYFLGFDENNPFALKEGQSILFEGNLCRRAGYGFGSVRPDIDNQTHIRTGGSDNMFRDFEIKNNIFDRAIHTLVNTTITSIAVENDIEPPKYMGNTYIQGVGNGLYIYGLGMSAKANLIATDSVKTKLGDTTAQVYLVDNIPKYSFSYVPAKTVPVDAADRRVFEVKGAEIMPSEGESTAISEPLFMVVQKSKKIYKEVRAATALESRYDEATGITYNEVSILNADKSLMLDYYGIKPEIPVSNGYIYVKILMRTNQQVKPSIYSYSLKDADGEAIGGSATAIAISTTAGSGEWEEIIVKVENFPELAATTGQLHIVYGGNLKGTDCFDEEGNPKDVQFDIAGWAVFGNLASAQNFSLIDAAK